MTLSTVLHHAGLALAVAALLGAGVRLASLATPCGLVRAVATVPLAAALAVAEALGLGLFGLGGSSPALVLAAVATWLAARRLLPAPPVRPLDELVSWWRRRSVGEAALAGAVAGAWGIWSVWLMLHPALGRDMVLYHLPEAVDWVHSGHTGSVQNVISGVPVGSYPLTYEVLLEWGLAIGRSFVWATVVTAAMPALIVLAVCVALRELGVSRLAAALAGAALVATPAVIASQAGGASLDPAALAWLLCCAALCAGARERPAQLAPALVAAALAIGTKTTTAPLAVAVLLLAGFGVRHRLGALVPALAAAAALGVAVGGVWYIRNLFEHGWPLWPFSAAPWGDKLPPVIAQADVRFIDNPSETLSRLWGYYRDHFGGPLVLLAGALLAPFVARSRAVAAATVATLAAVFLWMNAPFTGVLPTRAFDVGTGDATRYLLPGAAAAALAIALASRRHGWVRRASVLLLAAATAVGLHDTLALGFPAVPKVTTPAAGAALGAAAAAGLALARGVRLPRAAVGVASLIAAAVLGAWAADGYVARHGSTQTRESRVAGWFAGRRAWRDGSAPVASTWSLIGPLAGDRLQHPLVLLPARSACVRATREPTAWLVLDLHQEQAQHARPCRFPPGYSDGDFAAYAPRSGRLDRLAGG